jgi:hypothetical protein
MGIKKRKTAINKAHNYGILQRRVDIINMDFYAPIS